MPQGARLGHGAPQQPTDVHPAAAAAEAVAHQLSPTVRQRFLGSSPLAVIPVSRVFTGCPLCGMHSVRWCIPVAERQQQLSLFMVQVDSVVMTRLMT